MQTMTTLRTAATKAADVQISLPDAEDIHAGRILAAEARGWQGDLGNFQAQVAVLDELIDKGEYRVEVKAAHATLHGPKGVVASLFPCLRANGTTGCHVMDVDPGVWQEWHPCVIETVMDVRAARKAEAGK